MKYSDLFFHTESNHYHYHLLLHYHFGYCPLSIIFLYHHLRLQNKILYYLINKDTPGRVGGFVVDKKYKNVESLFDLQVVDFEDIENDNNTISESDYHNSEKSYSFSDSSDSESK